MVVPPLPLAAGEVVNETAQGGLEDLLGQGGQAGDGRGHGRVEVGMRALPVRPEEPIGAVGGDRNGHDVDVVVMAGEVGGDGVQAGQAGLPLPDLGQVLVDEPQRPGEGGGSQVSTTWRSETRTSSSSPLQGSTQWCTVSTASATSTEWPGKGSAPAAGPDCRCGTAGSLSEHRRRGVDREDGAVVGLVEAGTGADDRDGVAEAIRALGIDITPFTPHQAVRAGLLWTTTHTAGLSLDGCP